MKTPNDVLAKSPDAIPPMRDIDGVVTFTRLRRISNMHAFSQNSANAEDDEERIYRRPTSCCLRGRTRCSSGRSSSATLIS
jgi:hypothetical protein